MTKIWLIKLILISKFTNARTNRSFFKNLIQFWITIKFRIFIDFFCFVCETFAKFDFFLIQMWRWRQRWYVDYSIHLHQFYNRKHNDFCDDIDNTLILYFDHFHCVFVCFSHAYCVQNRKKYFDWNDFAIDFVVDFVVEIVF